MLNSPDAQPTPLSPRQFTEPHAPQAQSGPSDPGDPSNPGSRAIVVAARDITKTYTLGRTQVHALRGVSLVVRQGEFVAIMGPSGSGKSTFMNLLGCLDRPSAGEYRLMGTPVSRMTPDALADIRSQRLGFIFQGFNLLSRATALKNVQLPMVYAGVARETQKRRARKALDLVGLGDRLGHKPAELSGGQQQRVAIARALVNNPSLLLADEPTGNLDSHTSLEIMAILQRLNQRGVTIVLVTHELDITAYARRQVVFRDGRIVRDQPVATLRSAADELQRQAALQATTPREGSMS
ncbi:MAG TPA: ABC transporter ATP-binding protein [Ktedonobacterales bacterium]|nr:ABC transporter ATP-binding protein [Ktedonobacterales bacterium]